MLETGCYIDNSAGVYSDTEVLELLGNMGDVVEAEIDWQEIRDVQSVPSFDRAQFAYELEVELIDKINDALLDTGVILELFEGAYCIVNRDDLEEF